MRRAPLSLAAALLSLACQPPSSDAPESGAPPPAERALIAQALELCRDLQTTCEALSAGHFLEAERARGVALDRITDIPEMNGECFDLALRLGDSPWFKAGIAQEKRDAEAARGRAVGAGR